MSRSNQIRSFESLFRTHFTLLYKVAMGILRSESDAKEMVQETFIRVWERRDFLAFDESLKPYLIRATRNQCLNFLKEKWQERLPLDGREVADNGSAEKEKALVQRRVKKVMAAVDKLPEKCREIFMLSRVDGLTYQEIADTLDISVKTVENQISIGLRKIRAEVVEKEKKNPA